MDYATPQDLEGRFGAAELIQLTDPAEQAAVDTARVQRAIEDATALANAHLGKIYALPLAGCIKPAPVPGNPAATQRVPPPQLTRIVCDVARYYLYDDLAPEAEIYRRFKTAVAELQAIAAGDVLLACPWGGEPGAPAAGGPATGETLYQFRPRSDAEGYR